MYGGRKQKVVYACTRVNCSLFLYFLVKKKNEHVKDEFHGLHKI